MCLQIRLLKNQKIDLLYSVILFLLLIILILLIKLLKIDLGFLSNTWFLFIVGGINLPMAFRRKNQHQKFEAIRKKLNLSIEEVRELVDLGKYDLIDWDWKNAFISSKKLYLLEDKLDKKYIAQFGEEFRLK